MIGENFEEEERYLLFQPIGGINNSYRGLIEALEIGTYLNRTIILPHSRENSDKPWMNPIEKYYEIKNYKTISLEEFKKKKIKVKSLIKLELTYRYEFYNQKFQSFFKDIAEQVSSHHYFKKELSIEFERVLHLKMNMFLCKDDVIEIFGNFEEKVLCFNFLFSLIDKTIISDINNNVQPHYCYFKKAIEFIETKHLTNYLAIHFRRGDFKVYKDMYEENPHEFLSLFEGGINSVWPSLEHVIRKIKENLKQQNLKKVFICTNLSEDDEEIKFLAKEFEIVKFKPNENLDPIEVALIEMIISSFSDSFIGNCGSTFSYQIFLWRKYCGIYKNKPTFFW